MLERPLRLAATGCTVLVLLGWWLFALDEVRGASRESVAGVAGLVVAREIAPTPRVEALREQAHGDTRELVDDINDVLLSPFAELADADDDVWTHRTLPVVLALLAYGLGLGMLARYAHGIG